MDRQKRHQLQVPVVLPATQAGTTVDLGERGLGFVSPQRYKVGEQLQLRVMLSTDQPVTMRTQIIWCKQTSDQRYRCGAQLRAIGLRDSLFLKDYLTRAEHQAA